MFSVAAFGECDFKSTFIKKADAPDTVFLSMKKIGDIYSGIPVIPLNEDSRYKLERATSEKLAVCMNGTKFVGRGLFVYNVEFL